MKEFKFKQNDREYTISINGSSCSEDRNECEHCGTLDQFNISIFDGSVDWCENCADAGDIKIPSELEKEVSEHIKEFAIEEYTSRLENITGKKVQLV